MKQKSGPTPVLLRRLVAGDPAQRARVNTIGLLIPDRFALLDTGIALLRSGAVAEATSADRMLFGKAKMDQLRGLVADLQAREKALLAEKRVAEQRSVRNASIVVGVAASDAKSAFLATMSHELRTPLNAIIGYQSLLAEGIDGALSKPQLAHLGRIRASADHLLGLIDEVLTFSRVDADKEVVRRDEVQLGPIVAEALTMVTPLAEAKGLRLRNESADARLLTDAGKVRQIILNLLSNAIKFSDDGEIVLRSKLNGDSVAVSIVDSGIGISPENLGRARWTGVARSR